MDHAGWQVANPTAEPVGSKAGNFAHVNQTQKHSALCTVTQENMRMRQTINKTMHTMNQWIRQTQQQTQSVIKLADTLRATIPNKNNSRHDLDAMIKQMKVRESRWAEERLAFERHAKMFDE